LSEGLSPGDVGKELTEHGKRHADAHHAPDRRDVLISISEAIVLSVVTIVAAWSGFSAAKWKTESDLEIADGDVAHTQANRSFGQSLTIRGNDATAFNAWFGAYTAGRARAAAVAARQFRPGYRAAFEAWLATHPFTNHDAPPDPQSMPQYRLPGRARSVRLDAKADHLFEDGAHAAEYSDKYVRTTVILASVLFLVGIGTHFPSRGARIGLVAVGLALLGFAVVLIALLPAPGLG
jgi:hypothetical protein